MLHAHASVDNVVCASSSRAFISILLPLTRSGGGILPLLLGIFDRRRRSSSGCLRFSELPLLFRCRYYLEQLFMVLGLKLKFNNVVVVVVVVVVLFSLF